MDISRIKKLAKQKGWSLSFLASQFGLYAGYFTDVKNGKTVLSDTRIADIAKILNTTPEYLNGETDDPEQRKKPAEDNDGLSEAEQLMLDLLRKVPPDRQDELLALIESHLKIAGLLE